MRKTDHFDFYLSFIESLVWGESRRYEGRGEYHIFLGDILPEIHKKIYGERYRDRYHDRD